MVAALRLGRYLGSKRRSTTASTSACRRGRGIAPNTLPAMAKAGGQYLAGTAMQLEARRNGYTEAIALGTDGTVSEGAGANLFVVSSTASLYTPGWTSSILLGITRHSVMALGSATSAIEVDRADDPARDALRRRRVVPLWDGGRAHAGDAALTASPSVSGVPGPVTRAIQAIGSSACSTDRPRTCTAGSNRWGGTDGQVPCSTRSGTRTSSFRRDRRAPGGALCGSAPAARGDVAAGVRCCCVPEGSAVRRPGALSGDPRSLDADDTNAGVAGTWPDLDPQAAQCRSRSWRAATPTAAGIRAHGVGDPRARHRPRHRSRSSARPSPA